MVTIIGRVEYIAGINGDKMVAEARTIGGKAGKAGSKEFEDSWEQAFSSIGKKMARGMRDNGDLAGISFGSAFKNAISGQIANVNNEIAQALAIDGGVEKYVSNFDDARAGTANFRKALDELRGAGVMTNEEWHKGAAELEVLTRKLDAADKAAFEMSETQRRAALRDKERRAALSDLGLELDRVARKQSDSADTTDQQVVRVGRLSSVFRALRSAVSDFSDMVVSSGNNGSGAIGKLRKESDGLVGSWKDLPHGARQFAFYVALFASMASEIAVLSSAAGGGLTILAGAALSAVLGLGVAVAAFAGLSGDIAELPEQVRPAAEAFQRLGDVFSELQDKIQIAAISNATGAFEAFGETIRGLTAPIERLASYVGLAIDQIAASVAVGSVGFQNWSKIIDASGPIFLSLVTAATNLGTALGGIFVAALPFVQIFSDYLATILGQFSTWANSTEGLATMNSWLESSLDIFRALEPLIGATATLLSDLVTPETVAQVVEFLDNLTGFMPALSGILQVLGDLNIFGLLAELLNLIGQALMPIIPAFQTMATILSSVVSYALQSLVGPLTEVMAALAPYVPQIAELAAGLVVALIPALVGFLDAIALLLPQLQPLFDAIMPLIPSVIQLGDAIGAVLVAAVQSLLPTLVPLIELIADVLIGIQPLIPVVVLLATIFAGALVIALTAASTAVGIVIKALDAIIQPIVVAAEKLGIGTDAFEGMSDAVDNGIQVIRDWGNVVGDVVDNVLGWINDALAGFARLFSASASAPSPGSSGSGSGGGGGGGFAAGGVVNGADFRLTGEAGPEAIVPLNRPLSMVSPDVRGLSAIAQGLAVSKGGKQVTVMPGAIVVQASNNPINTAESVLDRLVGKL